MSLKKAIYGNKILKLNIVIIILLVSIGTVYAPPNNFGGGNCHEAGEVSIWTQYADGTPEDYFNLGDNVYLGGGVFDPHTTYSYSILDDTNVEVGNGNVSTDESGAINAKLIRIISSADLGRTYTVELTVPDSDCGMMGLTRISRSPDCCADDPIITTSFSVKGETGGDGTSEIPEYPTVIIPAIMAFGGYMVIRSRRKEE